MRSKWEWIRDACRELGYEEAAGIADEIELVLKSIYGDTKTIAWMRDYIDIKEEDLDTSYIWHIAGRTWYCIACVVEHYDCRSCKFKKQSGGCYEIGSIYRQFCELFYMYKEKIKC